MIDRRTDPVTHHRTLIVGVGGQGVLTAAKMLGDAAHGAGLPVVIGQLHGMSQRGGSIECTVKVGPGESTVIGPGEADTVIAFEPLEALRALPRMHEDTCVLVNLATIVPFELTRTGGSYPAVDDIVAELRRFAAEVVPLDGARLVAESGADRTLNTALLGAAAALGWLPVDEATLLAAVEAHAGPRFRDASRAAFALGREEVCRTAATAGDEATA